ncbi:MAG: TIGR03790 family protein [Deltaproteobacteria bacterium]|nr:TIGR03790 family protein [Deltaproteobacteria bacterium]
MKPITLLAFFVWLALTFAPSPALALSPVDLIIVYNRNLPQSREVAQYYAGQRQVPSENLLAVDVSTGEGMSREDYEEQLAGPVRARVRQFQAAGRQPAVLLVYGIPLRVDDPLFSRWFNQDQEFLNLAQAKARELTDLCWRLNLRLQALLTGQDHAPAEVPPSAEVVRRTRQTLEQALNFLEQKPPRPGFDLKRTAVASQIIQLAGSGPEYDAYLRSVRKRRGGPPPPLPPQLQYYALLKTGQEEAAFRGIVPETALELAPSVRHTDGLLGELLFWEEAAEIYRNPQTKAAVDSELTLALAGEYQTARWLPNPFLPGHDRLPFIAGLRQDTLMVGRLDGPTPAIAKRLVDDALAVEKTGLSGAFYIDARGLPDGPEADAYGRFDGRLRRLADLMKQQTSLTVILDNQPALFLPGSSPQAALYVGWYSLRHYVDAFTWQPGAVAFHVASSECATLRQPGSNVWCKRLLEKGVAATLGPVAEPYLSSFPLPDEFFPLLLSGRLPLLEVYFRTTPYLSWRQVLIGDPLYTPFKTNPAITD